MPLLRTLFCVLVIHSTASAGDWPQWLGPNRDGGTAEKVSPWKGPLKILWRQPVGEGHSSPVVSGTLVFLHSREGDNVEQVAAFDAVTGNPAWKTSYTRANFKSLFGNGPRATPAVAQGKVFTYGITGVLTCFDAAKGTQLWQVDALKEFQTKNLFFGVSCSPLVEKGAVLINVGGKGASVVAFDKNTGKALWKNLDDGASYASPIIFGEGKTRQAVFLTQEGLISVSPTDGSLFWKSPLKDKLLESSTTPVKIGDLILGSSITRGSVGLRLEVKDGRPEVSEVWKSPNLSCYFSTPVAVGTEHLYMVTGKLELNPLAKKKPSASLRCVEAATGKELWARDGVGTYHASVMRTGDNKLLVVEEKGDLVLVEPNPKEYRELARTHICGNTWAHPALANGKLYIRDEKELICVELSK